MKTAPKANSVGSMISEFGNAAKPVSESRDAAKIAAVRAIRKIEAELSKSLDGERIRGLPNIAPHGSRQFVAARVGSSGSGPLDGKPTLCMGADGLLVKAFVDADGSVSFCEARDSDLMAEDLASYIATLASCLDAHKQASANTADRYSKITNMAKMVIGCLLQAVFQLMFLLRSVGCLNTQFWFLSPHFCL